VGFGLEPINGDQRIGNNENELPGYLRAAFDDENSWRLASKVQEVSGTLL
jgi:hypothetical protein